MRIQPSVTFIGVAVVVPFSWLFSLVTQIDAFSSQRISGTGGSSSASLYSNRACNLHHRDVSPQTRRTIKHENNSILFLQEPSTEESSSLEEDKDNEPLALASPSLSKSEKVEVEGEESSTVVKDTVRKVVKQAGKGVFYGFGIFMNIYGLYFAFGLLLNIFGYAYEFSFRDGYHIDTIENKRIERQFERESRRYEKERYELPSQFAVEAAAEEEASTAEAAVAVAAAAASTK